MVLLQGYILLHLYLTVGLSSKINETYKLEWEPKLPLRINHEVILKCKVPNCCTQTTKWIGGPEGTLLTYQKHSLNNTKYKEIWGRNENYLVIYNFGLHDANNVYTCYHGFDNYGRNLTLDRYAFQLLPTDITVNKDVNMLDGYLNVFVEFIEVYPEPDCRITFHNEDISNFINKTEKIHEYFFRVKYFLKYAACPSECNGNLTMKCAIGTQNMTPLEVYVVIQPRSCSNSILVSLPSLLVWMMSVCLWVCIYFCRCWKFQCLHHQRIESIRHNAPVFAVLSLALVIGALIYLLKRDSSTTENINDSANDAVNIVVFSLVVAFSILCIVASLLLFRKNNIKKSNNTIFVIGCLEYWCCACFPKIESDKFAFDVEENRSMTGQTTVVSLTRTDMAEITD